MLDRLVSYLFTFLLILFFVVIASPDEQNRLIIALLFSIVIVAIALFMNWLSTDGAGSALVIGTVAYGLGGWVGAYAILFFFGGTQILSIFLFRKQGLEVMEERYSDRRDGSQVWANGFIFTALLFLWFYFDHIWLLYLALSSIAVALADTWASETGERLENNTILITNFKKVTAGTDGGISLAGTSMALLGSVIFALGYLILFSYITNWQALIAISAGGFLGCIVDSYLGAIFQHGKRKIWLPFNENRPVTNNNVNALATVAGAGTTLVILILFEYALV